MREQIRHDDAKAIRVHHYHPFRSHNSGDALVTRALRQAFIRHLGPAEFIDFPASRCSPDVHHPIGVCHENVRRNNEEADIVLIGGSNLLEPYKPRGRGQANLPLVVDLAALANLHTPVLLAGMGTGSSFGKGILRYTPTARDAIRLLSKRSLGFAVRDIVTVERLADIGVPSVCTGCPVTFLTDQPIRGVHEKWPLLVSMPPARNLTRFLGRAFTRLAMTFVEWLKGLGVPVVVTLHERRDWEAARQYVPSGIDVFYTESVDELIARFEQCIGVVGFRLHAGLLGMGLGKPIVPAAVDWRGRAAVKTFGFEDIAIRPFRLGQLAKLKRMAQRLLVQDPEFIGRQRTAKERFRARHGAFFEEAAHRFSTRVPAR